MKCGVLVPMKELSLCKTRLAAMIPEEERRRLVLAMLKRVVKALEEAQTVQEVTVVGGGAAMHQITEVLGACWLPELSTSLNATLLKAFQRQLQRTADVVGIVLGDLPFLQSYEVDGLLTSLRENNYDCVLAPAVTGLGTNAIFTRIKGPFNLHFGPESLKEHMREFLQRGYRVGIWSSFGFAHDIDTPKDLRSVGPLLQEGIE